MSLTKQDVIRQIQQGKVQTALEGMVQLSGLARDKEVQQRCVLLQSQLSQLNAKFGMGTFDNKTYQLELNRITQAALEIAYEMPVVIQAPPQYGHTAYQRAPQSSSMWKTWGILLTGAVGVVVLLVVIGLAMQNNMPNANALDDTQKSFIEPQTNTTTQYVKPIQANRQTEDQTPGTITGEKPNAQESKLVGTWGTLLHMGGIPFGNLRMQLTGNNRYVSAIYDLNTGSILQSNSGRWKLSADGMLRVESDQGEYELYRTQMQYANQFTAVIENATNTALIGASFTFDRVN